MSFYSLNIDLPIRVPLQTKKSKYFYLNLNIYRNAHFYTLDQAKKIFENMVWSQLDSLPKFKNIELTYILYPGSNQKLDVANICCIVDKFFCDTLVHKGVIEDDNYNVIKKINYLFGKVDKNNPHVNVTLTGDLL